MSRNFSLYLIALGITLLGGLICLHLYLMDKQHSALFSYNHLVNERLIEQKKEEIRHLRISAQAFLMDPIYSRRLEVLKIFTEADMRMEEYFNALEEVDQPTITGVPDVHYLANAALSPVLDTAVQVFRRSHLGLDLSERDMRDLTSEFDEMRHGVTCTYSIYSIPSSAFQLERETITLELLADVHDLLMRVASLSCYRGCGPDTYFPFLMNSYTHIKSGEIVNTQIGVGTFTSTFGTEHSAIVVDGDTLTICEDGLADYSFRSGPPGRYSKRLKMITTNPLTGESMVGESIYNYQVY